MVLVIAVCRRSEDKTGDSEVGVGGKGEGGKTREGENSVMMLRWRGRALACMASSGAAPDIAVFDACFAICLS